MPDETWPAEGRRTIDTTVAHSARVHDYWLGGKAAQRYNRLARETQRHRNRDEVARFFDGLDLVTPGLVPVQQWRPASELEARARSAMWGGVARKP
jgi:S-adenosyl methyltransferase